MGYYQVSDENMQKVEAYFVRRAKEVGNRRFEATVIEIAEGSGVALATAHKAIKQLSQQKLLTIIRPSSRRFAISYVYNGDIENFEQERTMEEQIEYLQKMVAGLNDKVNTLSTENRKLRGENIVLQQKLDQYTRTMK